MSHTISQEEWLAYAKQVLAKMKMSEASIEWLAYTHNAVFKVTGGDGLYVLRLGKYYDDLSGEMAVLKQLAMHRIHAPYPLQITEVDGISGLLMGHLNGEARTPETVTLDEMQAIGGFLAQLHSAPIHPSHRPALDWHGLFGEHGVYYPNDENRRVFTDGQLTVMTQVAEKVRQIMKKLGNNEFGVIHGDLLLKNILFLDEMVQALDWEFSGTGYYLYDLTPLLWQLKPTPNYQQLEDALWQGYTRQRPVADSKRSLLETLIAGRQVASMYWVANNQQNPHIVGKVEAILAQRTAELQGFLETGILERH